MNEQESQKVPAVNLQPRWKKAPTIMQLKQDLEDAKPVHTAQMSKIERWLDNLHIRGSAKIKLQDGNSKVQPKLIRKQAEWRYPALSEPFLNKYDIFEVKPKTWEDRQAAMQNQLVLNYQFNSLNKVRFIDQYVRAAVDEGTAIVRTGWEYEDEQYEEEVPEFVYVESPAFASTLEQVAALKEESPSQFATDVPEELKEALELSLERGVPVEPKPTGQTKWVTRTRVLVNRPTAEICKSANVVFDPTCKGEIEKAGFAVFSFESSLAILSKDKRYKNLDQIQIENNNPLSQPDYEPNGGMHNFNFSDKARKKFVVYEYWGMRDVHGDGTLTPIVAAWVGNTMIRLEVAPFPDKELPFIVVQYLPIRDEIYGEPDGELLEDNQKIIGAVTRGMIDIMGKSANGQTGMRKDMLDVTNRRKFEKGQDYEYNPNTDPRQGVYQHVFPEIPNSAPLMLQMQNYEAESLTGVKGFSEGISGASLGDVAAGVRGALDAASKRELAILRRLADGIVKIGRKWMSMNAEFLSDEEVVRITNDTFVKVRRDDLAGKFDLDLSISTAEEDDNKAQQLAFMFQTIGPKGDPGLTKMILSDIARLRKMPDLAKKIEDYEPQPDPLAQKIQLLEIAKLEAEVAEIQARAASHAANAQLSEAKAGTEEVKQGNIQSDTDQKNLNFVEQESGVTQERAKELHGAQAKAQGELKVLERSLEAGERQKDRDNELIKEYVKARLKPKPKAAA